MKKALKSIFKRTTEYSHPNQATTTANALDLLSSGIYTEEERFIFELLQNAVDSYDNLSGGLDVKIIVDDNRLIFMHNGKSFSKRDLDGLCDIGNGNKMSDAKKIGYKGIGFKSVFMHSKRVTVITSGICFRFDKGACEELAASIWKQKDLVKMPWQIIPIETKIPKDIKGDGYNVITILELSNTTKILNKVEKLLSDARFLLFLNVDNLKVSLFNADTEILNLSKSQDKNVLTLAKNNVAQSRWLMYSKKIKITDTVKDDLIHDSKTPDKLKKSGGVEISFAIALNEKNNIIPLNDAVVYTYLPTSFSFGFDFIVNANFITDAGRQQLIKDCEWNKFIFSQIPSLFLNWIKNEIAPNYKDWYKVLLPIKHAEDELSVIYSSALSNALLNIPFVRSIHGNQCLIAETIFDKYGFHKSLPKKVFNSFLKQEFRISNAYNTIIPVECGNFLRKYGIKVLSESMIQQFLEDSNSYLNKIKDSQCYTFITWLNESSELHNLSFDTVISYAKILPCDDGKLHEAVKVFFPSEYREMNEIAEDAIVLKESFSNLLSPEMRKWLEKLGVQKMSDLTVIDKLLCQENYITKDNAINVLQFIFYCNRQENIFQNISDERLSNLKILTTKGTLKNASELYLSDIYNPSCKIETGYDEDIFVSKEYIESSDDIIEWALFFKNLGVCDDIKLTRVKYGEDSWVMKDWTIHNLIEKAKCTEYNTSFFYGWRYYLGCAGGVCVYARTSIFLNPTKIYDNPQRNDFYSNIWGRIFSQPIPYRNDYIYGETGCGHSKCAYLEEKDYLNMTFVEWLTRSFRLIPASDGELHQISEVLPNVNHNYEVFGKYFPVIQVNGTITQEWWERLAFKKDLSLTDYLDVLENISNDDSKEQIAENKERICRIYDRIAEGGYDFREGSSDYKTLQNWGKTHKILSSEGCFEYPRNTYLLSSKLSGVELKNQAYHRKNQENERFALMMKAFGVNFIADFKVEGLESATLQNSIKESLLNKIDFFTALTFNEKISKAQWVKQNKKMTKLLNELEFYKVKSIRYVYGKQSIEKPVYVTKSQLYFVGEFGFAVKELLHEDIVHLIGLHKNDRSVFLTLMNMKDFDEMIEFLQFKGYDTHFISRPQLHKIGKTIYDGISIQGESQPYGGLTEREMKAALMEAKDAVLAELSSAGFDVSSAKWDGWTCINGVKKDGVEYPLVFHSNKSGRNTSLTPSDWNQLIKPNAMLAVNTSNGVGTINFIELLTSRENLTIRFNSNNFRDKKRILSFADAFRYFKGIQFDYNSFVMPEIGCWQKFMAPELNTGEEAIANTNIPLPN